MSYSSYNNETPLDLNNVRNVEGLTDIEGINKKLDEIKSTIADFKNKKQLIVKNAGWWTSNSPNHLLATIKEATKCSNTELKEMGQNGRNWIKEDFSLARKITAFAIS